MSIRKKWELDRRTFLHGMGVSIGLPFLEAMMPSVARAANGKTQRLVWIYLPNGYSPKETDINNPQNYTMPALIQNAMGPIRADTTVISGLSNFVPSKWDLSEVPQHILGGSIPTGDSHPDAFVPFVTGGYFVDKVSLVQKTFDQHIADVNMGSKRRSISAVLRLTDADKGSLVANKSSTFNSMQAHTLSYEGPDRPVGYFTDPRALFNQLFSGGTTTQVDQRLMDQIKTRRGILHYVMEDIGKVNRTLGKDDKVRLDEFLTGLNEYDRKLASTSGDTTGGVCTGPSVGSPAADDSSYPQRLQMFYDLLLFAFKCDLTRVGTVMHAREGTRLRHPFVSGLSSSADWHSMSHLIRNPEDEEYGQLSNDPEVNWQDMCKVVAWHYQKIAEFVLKLKQTQLPNGQNLLDESAIVWGSAISKGMHDNRGLILNIAGSANGALKKGMNINAQNGPVANVWLTLMQAMGSTQSRYGLSTGPISSWRT